MANTAFPQESYDTLVEKIYAPVFLTKLASDYGVVPQSEEERQALLEMAGVLREAQNQGALGQTKQAGSVILEASDGLKTALGQAGYATAPTTDQRLVKAASAQAALDPTIQEAALAYGQFLFEQMNGRA